jgi:RNA polymerase sigma-70 factor (ECF subfamily)
MLADAADYFEQHRHRVYRWAVLLCGRADAAADITQEVFLRMVRQPPEVPDAAAGLGWLRQVTLRLAIDALRAQTARTRREHAAAVGETQASGASTRALATEAWAALADLSPQQRLVLLAKVCDGLTFAEIAAELDLAVPTVKTHYVRALEAARRRLGVLRVTESVP